MKQYIFLTLIGLSLAGGNASAKPPTVWHTGVLLLSNGTELTGDLNYNWKAEIVQIRLGDGIKAYSAFHVREFTYFDDKINTLRKFASVEHPIRSSLRRLIVMEQLMEGPMTVYRRLRHAREPIAKRNLSSFGNDAELTQNLDSFDYFVYKDDGVVKLDHFVRDIWPVMQQEYHKELTQYGTTLLIDRNTTLARLLFINQYNSLKAKTADESAGAAAPGMYGGL
ncbi:hypothetical protein [Spirosoma utsteinense]|uniref:DUF4369 domain-containing protein n=1 Tax=Spirosoma utsteinense TaxID=2585773 RepID=A0ABR6WCW0_9BACT|nr:hypothetical protein [Spirosoma utsteinense]MBC3788832.1 hypothetical protein [Spirosoma utsteinense]MBC3794134.1 hypothetical protein [Spirosoma utsteinense]